MSSILTYVLIAIIGGFLLILLIYSFYLVIVSKDETTDGGKAEAIDFHKTKKQVKPKFSGRT